MPEDAETMLYEYAQWKDGYEDALAGEDTDDLEVIMEERGDSPVVRYVFRGFNLLRRMQRMLRTSEATLALKDARNELVTILSGTEPVE